MKYMEHGHTVTALCNSCDCRGGCADLYSNLFLDENVDQHPHNQKTQIVQKKTSA